MVHTFIVTNKFVSFKLQVDGKVEVKPIPHDYFNGETVHLLAKMHRTLIMRSILKNNEKDLVTASLQYFDEKGFLIKPVEGGTGVEP
jgi:hypothetical protein